MRRALNALKYATGRGLFLQLFLKNNGLVPDISIFCENFMRLSHTLVDFYEKCQFRHLGTFYIWNQAMEMAVETFESGVTVVRLTGRLDIAGAEKIDLHFSVISGSQRKVIVDLEKVTFLASMGVRTLIMGARSIRSKGGKAALFNPTSDVEKVLTDTGTDTLMPIVHDFAAALDAVQG
jgi:anti-anti-sigma factor